MIAAEMFKLETILSARSSDSEMGLSDLINKLKQNGSENWSLGHGGKASEQCVSESRDRLSRLGPNFPCCRRENLFLQSKACFFLLRLLFF